MIRLDHSGRWEAHRRNWIPASAGMTDVSGVIVPDQEMTSAALALEGRRLPVSVDESAAPGTMAIKKPPRRANAVQLRLNGIFIFA